MQIITISGKARHGKDTAAEMMRTYLNRYGYSAAIFHYADTLKMCATNYFNWNGEKDEAGRSLLQFIGTDVVRKNNENAWIEIAEKIINNVLYDCDFIIIPDARFPNEINFWNGAISVHVERPSFESQLTEEQKAHPSETALNGFMFNYNIEADALEELEESVKTVVKDILMEDYLL